MTISFDDLNTDELQSLGAHTVGRLERSIDRANEQFASVSGWLTAALFALNGGGAVASLNAASTLDAPIWSAGAFGAGLVLAMLSAVMIQQLISIASEPAEALMMFWRTVEVSGVADAETYEAMMHPITAQHRWYWIPPALGWFSGIAFMAGAATLAIDAANPNPSFVTTCARLQRAMLDPRSKSDRSRQLFTSIGCHYAG